MSELRCPKCLKGGKFRYSLGFTYEHKEDAKKRSKRLITIPDTIFCFQCGHKWENVQS
jgi:hypothetical protein